MMEIAEGIAPGYGQAILWTLLALVALFMIVALVRMVGRIGRRGDGEGDYGRGPRIAVLDAATVDDKRRLVLVRRDAIEHLILIGGPNDLVVEANIGRREVAETAAPRPRAPQPEGGQRRGPVAPARPAAAPSSDISADARVPTAPAARPEAAPASPHGEDRDLQRQQIARRQVERDGSIDDDMVREFEGRMEPAVEERRVEPSIEDEMDRLLNEPRQR